MCAAHVAVKPDSTIFITVRFKYVIMLYADGLDTVMPFNPFRHTSVLPSGISALPDTISGQQAES